MLYIFMVCYDVDVCVFQANLSQQAEVLDSLRSGHAGCFHHPVLLCGTGLCYFLQNPPKCVPLVKNKKAYCCAFKQEVNADGWHLKVSLDYTVIRSRLSGVGFVLLWWIRGKVKYTNDPPTGIGAKDDGLSQGHRTCMRINSS